MTIKEMFAKHDDEFLKFDRIPAYAKPYPNPDLCAFIYLASKLPCIGDVICAAGHDEIWLEFTDIEKLTEEDVIYITRCGVRYDGDNESLCMFV